MTARHRAPAAGRPSRRLWAGVAGMLVAVVLGSAGVVTSQASWLDQEDVTGTATSLNCSGSGFASSTATGTLLDGSLVGSDLGSVAALAPMTVVNGGAAAVPTPSAAAGAGTDAYANPLSVTAVSGAVTASTSQPLIVPLGTPVGVANQYAKASSNASSSAAAGYVTNSGAIAADAATTTQSFGEIDLGAALATTFGSSLSTLVSSNLTSLKLDVGAVASSAAVTGCTAAWAGTIYPQLSRAYSLAGLGLVEKTPLAAAVGTTVSDAYANLGTTAASAVGTAVVGAVGALASSLTLGTPTVSLAVTIDPAAVSSLLAASYTDTKGIVTLTPSSTTSTLRIDLAKLLGSSTLGLNGMPPNSSLLAPSTGTALQTAVGEAVGALKTAASSTSSGPLSTATVNATVSIPASGATLQVKITNAKLTDLLAGTVPVSLACTSGGLGCTVLNLLLALSTGAVNAAIGPAIGNAVLSSLTSTLATNLTAPTASLAGLATSGLTTLIGSTGLLSIVVNAQNAPDPSAGGAAGPAAWAYPGMTTAGGFSTGRWDVAALRIAALPGAGRTIAQATAFDLARSSVGANRIPAS